MPWGTKEGDMACKYCGDGEVDKGDICFSCMEILEGQMDRAEQNGDEEAVLELQKLMEV